MSEPANERRSWIDPYLVTWNVPRPLKLALAAVLWPIFGVMMLVGGAMTAVLWLGIGLLAVLVVVGLIYLLGKSGVHGFAYLADRPLSVVPHSLATGLSLLVALPLSVWWLRDLRREWAAEDERKAAAAAGTYDPPWLRPARVDRASERWVEKATRTARNSTAVVAWLVFLWTLSQAEQPVAANDPTAGIFVVALVAIAGGLAYLRLDDRVGDRPGLSVGAPIVMLLVAVVLGVYVGMQDRSSGQLRDYCEYGAVSRAQLAGCLNHVTNADINRLQTDAARFAKGSLSQCLSDSGPFCANRLAAINAPEPNP